MTARHETLGGATTRPLPAHPRTIPALALPGSRMFRGLPTSARAGAAVLGLGLALDVGYHLIHGVTPHPHDTGAIDVAMAIHLIVAAGMVLCLVGVIAAGIRSTRSTHPRRYHR